MLRISMLLFVVTCYGQTLNRGNGSEPDSLNPHLAQGLNSHHILYDLYEGLYQYDKYGKPALAAAESVEISDDGLIWTFTINPQARWSDGNPVLATHFKQAWQQASTPSTTAPYAQLFDNLIQQEKLNVFINKQNQLVVHLNQPNPLFPEQLSLPIFMPQHPQSGLYNGAYVLSNWQMQERITLQKNKHHKDASNIYFNTVNYWVTENQNSELNRFLAGELDITETIPDSKVSWLQKHQPDALRIAPYYGTFFLGLDLRDKHLANRELRQALSLSIDRDILVNKVLKSGEHMANGLIPQVNGHSGLDLIKAKSLLKQSGFDYKTEKLTLLYNNSQNQKKIALAVAAMWRQFLGVQTQLQNQEWKVFVNNRKKTGKQVFRGGWIADYYDPMNFLQLFQSDSHFNYYGLESVEYDATLKAWPTATIQERTQLQQQAETILATEVPMIPLYHYVSRHLVNANIQGFENNLLDKHLSRYIKQ